MYSSALAEKPLTAPKVKNPYETVDSFKLPLPDATVVLNLSELAEKHAQNVPFRFQVVNGFMAENSKDPTIGVDEVYTMHLVREIKVVVVKHDGEAFEIPIISAAKFGLVHNSKTSSYETVDDILSAKHLPKVIAVGRKYVDPEGGVSLRKGEVLIIKEVMKSKLGRKIALRVVSTSSSCELILRKDCDAGFSADPEATQLYLTEFFDNDIEFMPCSAKIYPGEGSSLSGLLSSVITIKRPEMHRSVVISLFRDNPTAERTKETSFIDIPTTIDICVRVIKTDNSDQIYQIFKQSEDLLMNPSRIQACVDASTDDHYMTQSQLLADMRKEKAKSEMAKCAPKQYKKMLITPKETPRENDYVPMSSGVPLCETKHSNTLPRQSNQSPHSSGKRRLKAPVAPPVKVSVAAASPPSSDGPKLCPTTPQMHDSRATAGETGNTMQTAQKETIAQTDKQPPKKFPKPMAKSQKTIQRSTSYSHELQLSTDLKSQNVAPPSNGVIMHEHPEPEEAKVPAVTSCCNGLPAETDVAHLEPLPVPARSPSPIYANVSMPQASRGGLTMEAMSEQLRAVQTTLSTVVEQIREIQTRQSALERKVKTTNRPENLDESVPLINDDMTPADVQRVLGAAGLSQYVESFSREAVDGEMFMMLDDEILSNELGVSSRLHRVRIMRMKEGAASS